MIVPQKTSVLLADDEEVVRKYFRRILTDQGFQVIAARDEREAVEIYRQRHESIDCVLLDFMMPGMDGEATFRELRQISTDVPVRGTSGLAGETAECHKTKNFWLNPF